MTGQVGHPEGGRTPALARVAVPAVAVLLAAVLLTALTMAALRSGTASAETVLREGAGVTAVLADGARRDLAPGETVPPGATVTARDGAVLRTRDRDVHLGPSSTVTVVDGARQQLTAGRVMVDARRGPGLELATDAAVVTTPGGALSRVEQRAVLRVGAFDGSSGSGGDRVRVQPTGRRTSTELARWTQAQVPVGGLPGRVTPLVLTGDRDERRLAAELVADDRMLSDLERTLDAGGPTAAAVLASLEFELPGTAPRPSLLPATMGPALPASEVAEGERALAYLLARAAEGSAPLGERYAEAAALRADGGSWGPVARLVEAPVPAVSALIDELLAPVVLAGGQGGVPVDLAALLAPPTAAPGVDGPGATAAPTGGPPAPGGSGTGSGGGPPPSDPPPSDPPPPGPPGPVPPPPPPPSDPVETVTDVVDTVVDTVIGLLPTPLPVPVPSPTPLPSPLPELPPLPVPTPSVPLLGG